jgi:hypothetical protein
MESQNPTPFAGPTCQKDKLVQTISADIIEMPWFYPRCPDEKHHYQSGGGRLSALGEEDAKNRASV